MSRTVLSRTVLSRTVLSRAVLPRVAPPRAVPSRTVLPAAVGAARGRVGRRGGALPQQHAGAPSSQRRLPGEREESQAAVRHQVSVFPVWQRVDGWSCWC
ncbi:hypothetical protein [Streptomyces cinereospinus]|uniref:hypothetical protein n=1 Tax=Streptomyces cinereospinus TaxID=285561 RepID=UPI003617DBBB